MLYTRYYLYIEESNTDCIYKVSLLYQANKPVESPPLGFPVVRPVPQPTPENTTTQPRPQPAYGKGVRFKGKRAYPTVPNQPSEASAYFMFELAKTVLNRAGGNSSTSLFTQVSFVLTLVGLHPFVVDGQKMFFYISVV